jgi:hypothetical protein
LLYDIAVSSESSSRAADVVMCRPAADAQVNITRDIGVQVVETKVNSALSDGLNRALVALAAAAIKTVCISGPFGSAVATDPCSLFCGI